MYAPYTLYIDRLWKKPLFGSLNPYTSLSFFGSVTPLVVNYGYDRAHRLTSESRTGTGAYSVSYTLDGEGNRTSQTAGTATTSFTYDNDDELTATSSSTGGFVNSYSYNANGEQTGRTLSGTAYTLGYDYDGQLTSLTQGTSTTSFAYDAEGRRTSRAAGGTTTSFLYAGSQILLEKQGSATTATYTYGNELIRKDSEYPLFDGLGTERTVTNGSQTVTGTLITSAFGVTVATTGSSANPYMFAATSGYRNDGDAGLMHVGARYYDAQVGRFITRDTYLDQKPYLYCTHDPINHLDPTGHAWWNPFSWPMAIINWIDDENRGDEALPPRNPNTEQLLQSSQRPANADELLRPQQGVPKTPNEELLRPGGEPPAGGGGGCFVAGTLVTLANGTVKPIDKVHTGEWVLARDETLGIVTPQIVQKVYVRTVHQLVDVQMATGCTIRTTDEHRFYVFGRGFLRAELLKAGMYCLTSQGKKARISTVRQFHAGSTKVYNLTISLFHTYFVGKDHIWVHNLYGQHGLVAEEDEAEL